MLGLGGLLARAILGDALYAEGANPNQALPLLFIELFPAWLAALIGVGVLAAIMSTADGLVISSSQVIANDLYRRSIVPRLKNPPNEEQLDQRVFIHQSGGDRRRAGAMYRPGLGFGRDQYRAHCLDRERRYDGGLCRAPRGRRALARRHPQRSLCRLSQRLRHLPRAAHPNDRPRCSRPACCTPPPPGFTPKAPARSPARR